MELPVAFTDYTRILMGAEEYDKLAEALKEEQPISIRLNETKLKEVLPDILDRKSTRLNSSHL